MRFQLQLRWVAVGVFMLAAVISFLDRQLLAAVAPMLKSEFGLSNLQYGGLVSAFSLVTAIAAPLAGLFVDRIGLNVGMCIAVGVWSLAGMSTGLTQGLKSLLACRVFLAAGESAGNLGAGKAGATYLNPAELGIVGGFGAASVTLGSMAAPLVVAWVAPHHGWRSVFVVCGALGLLWIPLWLFTSRRIPARTVAAFAFTVPIKKLLKDPQLWAVTASYALVYVMYSLWTNWTTIYFVQARHLTPVEANLRFAWFPPAFAILGGFWGGILAFRFIRQGRTGAVSRMRSCWFTAPLLVSSAMVPFMPTTTLAAVLIGMSFLCLQSLLANVHVILVDLFAAPRAAFTNSLSTSAAYLLQAIISPLIGIIIDRFGFAPVCIAVSVLPLLGLWGLQLTLARAGTSYDAAAVAASA